MSFIKIALSLLAVLQSPQVPEEELLVEELTAEEVVIGEDPAETTYELDFSDEAELEALFNLDSEE